MNSRTGRIIHTEPHHALGLLPSALFVWIGFVAVAVIADIGQSVFVAPNYGLYNGHLTSAIVLNVFVLGTTWFYLHRQHVHVSKTQLLSIGMLWVFMTCLFEFGSRQFMADRYVMRFLVELVMDDHNTFGGRFWQEVLLVQLVGPLLVGMTKDVISRRRMRG